ncbi:Cysteine-rich secretory protein family protein [Massilia sp. CF038]|nr:Cysteine-rich secretory protein family protein [Massilia sp. CF038]
MRTKQGWYSTAAALVTAWALVACGGGGGSPAPVTSTPPPVTPVEPGAPAASGNIATDGVNWANYRRVQGGLPKLERNALIDLAAQRHSSYQQQNTVSHEQEAGKPGFTGATLADRLRQVSYLKSSYFIGEVISAATSNSGFYLTEELITAIYHRFVIFEPKFKEIGGGSVTGTNGYTILTINFAANEGLGAGLGADKLATWPTAGQTGVTRNFMSDFESPDPVDNQNEVGYPVSVHADGDVTIIVTSFTMQARGGSALNVKLLSNATDQLHTPKSAAAIIPLSVLLPGTIYDVSFTGTLNGLPIVKTWSFTTK